MARRNKVDLPRKKGMLFGPGRAVWPHLHAPDTSFNKDPEYNTQLNLPAEEALPHVRAIDELWDEAVQTVADELGSKKAKRGPYAPYEEEEDGSYTFKFKMKAERPDGSDRKPKIFDAKGTKVRDGLKIGGGSTLRVNATASAYNAPFGIGVTLYLNAIQLLKLESWGANSADDFGFDSDESGFSADEADESLFGSDDEFAEDEAEDDEDFGDDPDLDADF